MDGAFLGQQARLTLLRRARRLSRRLPPPWDSRLRELGKFVVGYRGDRGFLLRGAVFALLGRRSQLLLAPFGEGELLVDARDQEIGRVVFMTGGYERIYMATALSILASASDRTVTGKTFVDVGANIGTSTIDALLHFGFGRAVCFEPDPRNLRLLELNLVLNRLVDRVEVHPIALSDHDGEARLECSSTNFGDTRLAPAGSGGRERDSQRVRCSKLDSLIENGVLSTEHLGLVWMDVQGHEPFALSGARRVLEAGIPTVIEYSPGALRSSGGVDLLEGLVSGNYAKVVDVRMRAAGLTTSASFDAAGMAQLRTRYDDADHTDLLLLPEPPHVA